jgi:acetolactate synthase-1/2/3 large subunit
MSQVHGGELVVRSLKNEGVQFLFSLPGHGIDSIYDACIDAGIRIIDTRHEQAASNMADAWFRVTGKTGVVAVTGAPGVVAMVSGIVNGESSPIIALAGRNHVSKLEMGAGQEMDQVSLMRPITKWARTVYETHRIPEYMGMAFRHATSGRPGPVYLDIPLDVIESKVDSDQIVYPEKYRTGNKPQGDAKAIQEAVELLLAAKRPLFIGGSGLWCSQVESELQELLEMVNIPFVLRDKGRGSVPEDHPLCVGASLVCAKQADVILAAGIRFDGHIGFGRPPVMDEKAKVIQIDIDAHMIGENRPIEVGIVGDAKLVLKAMVEEARDSCKGRKELPWVQKCQTQYKKGREAFEEGARSDAVPINPCRLLKEVSSFLDREAILTADGGETGGLVRSYFKCYYPGHMLDHHPMSCLGSGIPFGIAAKLAKPDHQVLTYNGDGSFCINGMEFDTAVRHRIPLVVVVANNGCWGTVRRRQNRLFGREIGAQLGWTRYDKLVEDLGGHGQWVERPEDIRPALQRAFDSGLPACVNVKTDPNIKGA